jgi:hypothetical protein
MAEKSEKLKKILDENPVHGSDLLPIQRIIIPLVEAGYTLRSRSGPGLTYGKDDHRVTAFADGETIEFYAPVELYFS